MYKYVNKWLTQHFINATVFITYFEVTRLQRGATHLARIAHVGEYPRALGRRLSLITVYTVAGVL